MKKLWVLADKLRGAFEVTELYKVMLYSLLLKYVEQNKEEMEFYDEKFSLGYLSLTYGKMVVSNQICEYMANIERYYDLASGVLIETIDTVLYKADSDSIRIIFEAINEVNTEELYDFAKAILDRMSIQAGKAGGECYSTSNLVKLEKAILDTEEGMTVYDAYCGSGLSANEVASGKGTVFIQDISVQIIGIAAVMSILSGNNIGAIRCGDSLQNPLDIEGKYDRIIMEAPFGVKYSPEYLMGINPQNVVRSDVLESESLAIRHSIAHLKKDGEALLLVPMGMLFKGGRLGELRKQMVENGYISSIIELPAGIIPSTGVATAFVSVQLDKKNDSIYMVNTKDYFEREKRDFIISDEKLSELVDNLKTRRCIENVSAIVGVDDLAKNEYNLCTSQYVISNPEDNIVIEDTKKLMEQYRRLEEQLHVIDGELDDIRRNLM
jgi:type I restriction enzyme M protein